MNSVLIIDDEPDLLDLLELTLLKMGLSAVKAGSVRDAQARLAQGDYALCLTDMRLPDGNGLDIVRHIGQSRPDIPVAVITAFGSTENAVEAMKAGAFDYLSKPVRLEQLRALVKTALKVPEKKKERAGGGRLLGGSPAMVQVHEMIEKLARTQAPVHITGESGSGKEVAARSIHELSARRDRPFVAVNCGAIPENLMESEFFGYRKGAFTGATDDREGFFQAAEGGTLFLDEVADLPLSMQVKLLRAIQEKRVRKVGATQEDAVDVRLISATHQDLAKCVAEGRFRQDLYFRLHVIEIHMPSLRDMPEDIPLLAESVLEKLAGDGGRAPPVLAPAAVKALSRYDFPGNVRELENILERALALSGGGRIDVDDLNLTPPADMNCEPVQPGDPWPLPSYLDQVEKEAILKALERTRYNKTAAARLLGITFRALRYRLERLGIE
jgi:two-component system response regulator PilR (NtrC family)